VRISVSLIALCIFIFSVGCQATPVDNETPLDNISSPAAPLNQGNDTHVSPSIPTPADPRLQDLIEKAKADLAQRLSIPADQINLVEVMEVEWPDSSLGCPNPSLMYTQVLTPGYLIRLQVLDKEFELHTNKGDLIIYCDDPAAPLPGTLPDR
jgi:hypothetical protein